MPPRILLNLAPGIIRLRLRRIQHRPRLHYHSSRLHHSATLFTYTNSDVGRTDFVALYSR